MSDRVLNDDQRAALLRRARRTIEQIVGAEATTDVGEEDLSLEAGVFVSLHKSGQLRGCIGSFDTTRPVTSQVEEMAVAAATRDPRFSSVTPSEVEALDIEISVLTSPRVIEDPKEIEVGTHGLIISRGYRRGVLLPQVAVEHRWDREAFLAHTCHKAGLPPDAWKDQETSIEVFTAEVFGEASP